MKQLDLNNLPPVLNLQEVSQILRVSTTTLKRWEKRGLIRSIRINSRGDRRYFRDKILARIPGYV